MTWYEACGDPVCDVSLQGRRFSVDRGHDRVDIYGYVSMAVATMQVQEKEIAQLRRDLAEVKSNCKR